MINKSFYLKQQDDQPHGPFEYSLLVEMMAQGVLQKETLCRPDDSQSDADWQPIGQLVHADAPTPPTPDTIWKSEHYKQPAPDSEKFLGGLLAGDKIKSQQDAAAIHKTIIVLAIISFIFIVLIGLATQSPSDQVTPPPRISSPDAPKEAPVEETE